MAMERKSATYADLEALPDNVVGELVNGELHASPRLSFLHAAAASRLSGELVSPFARGRDGPGGWIILNQPEVHLNNDVLVPDIAGWRQERMPQHPRTAAFTLAPDWACEVLSAPTKSMDRTVKLPVYAREGVQHVWLVDPKLRTLEVFRLDGLRYTQLVTHIGKAHVRAEPFEALELELAYLWGEKPPGH